ncbi:MULTISPECIES: site-2 protease family protein [Candidatus Ichthyocystis]|uniref:site-2 protease family protein n=1 Tax=Candidatus Ichthyocystis TaxID=2929841 RepID=UPI000B88E06E|nr:MULTISPECIES: site-2 protease family protein [Ichthyocystis]
MQSVYQSLGTISVIFLPIMLALTGHEIAHAYAASKFGDDTALRQGRLSMNPLHHIDPVGTVILPIILYILLKSSIGLPLWFGWAKPIPVNRARLRSGRYPLVAVSLSGPLANFAMSFAWAFVARILVSFVDSSNFWIQVAVAGIQINAIFLAFNMIPILPFDGGRVVHALLPPRLSIVYGSFEQWGVFAVLAVIILGHLIGVNIVYLWVAPFYDSILWLLHGIFGGRFS